MEISQAIVEQAADAIIYADRGGLIRVWNAGAERIFGYAAGEVLGQSLDIIIPEHLRAAHWSAFDRALDTGQTKYRGEAMVTRSMHKDGRKLYVEMSFALIRDAQQTPIGAVAIARDVTAARQKQAPAGA